MPLEIHFTKQYRYRLRGTDTVDGRDAWVVDFAPAGAGESGKLYQGTVWVDRQLYARLRTRAVQIGPRRRGHLQRGDPPLHADRRRRAARALVGRELHAAAAARGPADPLGGQHHDRGRARDPAHRRADQRPRLRGGARRRSQQSDATMVRDTEQGLRYLVKDESGRARGQGGLRHQQAVPARRRLLRRRPRLPAAARRHQLLLLRLPGHGQAGSTSSSPAPCSPSTSREPRLFGSRFDVGADLFALAVPFADTVFRDDEEVRGARRSSSAPASFGFKLGHPLGNFVKLEPGVRRPLPHTTATPTTPRDDFVAPQRQPDPLVGARRRASPRSGYGLSAARQLQPALGVGALGPAGQPGLHRGQAGLPALGARGRARTGTCPASRRSAPRSTTLGGSDLDRFSKYQFGFFGGTRVHGYQSNRVRAEEAWAAHLSYGFEIGECLPARRGGRRGLGHRRGDRPRQRAAGRRRPRRHVHRPLADGGQPRRRACRWPGRTTASCSTWCS